MAEHAGERWRTGTSPGTHGRTIYRQMPGGPERGELIGVMDTAPDAGMVVQAVNRLLAADRLRVAVDTVLSNWAHVRDHIGDPQHPICALFDQVAQALRETEVPDDGR